MNDLNLLHPKAKLICEAFLLLCKEQGFNIKVTQTLRTEAEQVALYAHSRAPLAEVNRLRALANMSPISASENTWRTNAKSIDNSFHGYGLAFDIAVVNPNGKNIDWSDKVDWDQDGVSDWLEVGRLANQIEGLEWGGNWTKSPDIPHYQCRFGLTIQDLKNGKRP